MTQMQWRNAQGERAGRAINFDFGGNFYHGPEGQPAGEALAFDYENEWYERAVRVVAPPDAAHVVLRFGFDIPNLTGGDYLRIDDITLTVTTERPKYQPQGRFISRPLHITAGPGRRLEKVKGDGKGGWMWPAGAGALGL